MKRQTRWVEWLAWFSLVGIACLQLHTALTVREIDANVDRAFREIQGQVRMAIEVKTVTQLTTIVVNLAGTTIEVVTTQLPGESAADLAARHGTHVTAARNTNY